MQETIINVGEVHIMKCMEGAFLKTHYTSNAAFLYQRKGHVFFDEKSVKSFISFMRGKLMSHGAEIVEEGFEDVFQEMGPLSQNRKAQLLHS